MSDIRQARQALIARILRGDGTASYAQRRTAFENAATAEPQSTLIDKVAEHANNITDADFATTLSSGFSEDQLFEIVVCAAIGQASREYETALAALDAAAKKA
jgi:hypothetical protein